MNRKSAKQPKKATGKNTGLYTLEVFLIGGPITETFAKHNPVISRTIEIRANQTLADLHEAIFKAFDREEEHMYEFQIGGKGPRDPKAKRYGLPLEFEDSLGGDQPAGDVARTTMASLNLKVDQAFGYWFDFGDDWWHQINVIDVKVEVPRGRYPKLTKRTGESPPQYDDWDEDE